MRPIMLYSNIHSLCYRVINKIRRTKKKKVWSKTPFNKTSVYRNEGMQFFEPNLLSPASMAKEISSAETIKKVMAVLDILDPDRYIDFLRAYYKKGLESFGDHWVYADINTALYVLANYLKVENYLEIGVRRGRSMAMVASQRPECSIYGFDLWIENYCGIDNPGKDFVKNELKKFNYNGSLTFTDGDSKKTIPDFFERHPDLYFDMITVDGDHSVGGAVIDIKNVIPRLKIGGAIVFDDISSHEHPYLLKVWNKHIKNNDAFASYTFTELGLGVGFAIRKY